MNTVDRSLAELKDMEALADQDSFLHSRAPLAKLIVVLAYILTVVSFHKYDLGGLVPMVL